MILASSTKVYSSWQNRPDDLRGTTTKLGIEQSHHLVVLRQTQLSPQPCSECGNGIEVMHISIGLICYLHPVGLSCSGLLHVHEISGQW